MSSPVSAGVLLHRSGPDGPEVLIAHPGGPIWARRDAGAWSIPKGLVDEGEDLAAAAAREFEEETGCRLDPSHLVSLGEVRLRSGKTVVGFAARGDLDPDAIVSNEFEMEWPPRSGRTARFPEIDRVDWVTPEVAAAKLNPAQVVFVSRLLEHLIDVDHTK